MAFYPVEHPNFRQRGKRKPLSFELDFSNPILQKYKLKNAIIAINDTTAIDFVTGEKYKSTSSSSPNSGYPDGIYINNDGNLGTFNHVIEKGCFVAHAKCTATYSSGASRLLLDWVGSGEVVQLQYNGFSSFRNWRIGIRGGFGTTNYATGSPQITSNAELQEAEFVVAGWDMDVGSSIDVGAPKIYNGTGGASTNDTNERSITICSSGWVGVFYSLFVFEEDLPANIKYELSCNPYQLLKPSIDVLWFLGGGGATYTLTADVNAITLGSDSVSLLANRNLGADVNAITLSSDAVTLTANRVLSADVNAVVLGSDSVSLTANRLLTADVNAITLGSDAVTLTYNSGATYTLTADANVITLGGDSVSLLTSRVLTADVSAIVLGGDSVTLTTGVVDTDDCYVWLQSQIVDTHYLTSDINIDEYIVAAIDESVTFIESELYTEESTTVYVTSAIDGDVIYLESKVCH